MTKELRYSRGKIIRLCLMLSLMVAIPAYFVSVAWLEHGASVLFGRKMFFLPLVAAMGGYLLIDLVSKLIRRGPAVVINERGVLAASFDGGQLVDWDKIAAVELVDFFGAYKEIHVILKEGSTVKIKSRYFDMDKFEGIYLGLKDGLIDRMHR